MAKWSDHYLGAYESISYIYFPVIFEVFLQFLQIDVTFKHQIHHFQLTSSVTFNALTVLPNHPPCGLARHFHQPEGKPVPTEHCCNPAPHSSLLLATASLFCLRGFTYWGRFVYTEPTTGDLLCLASPTYLTQCFQGLSTL